MKTKQRRHKWFGGGFWGGFGSPRGRKSGAGGPGFRAEGPEIPAPEGPEIPAPEGPEIPAPGGAGPRGPPPFFPLPHFSAFSTSFSPFFAFRGFRGPRRSRIPLRGSQVFDLFARVGRRGASRSTVFWARRGVPPLCCQKVMTYTRSCVGKSFEIRRVTVLEFGAGY